MSYILAIAIEKHQIQLKLFDQSGKATAVTQRFIEPALQALTDANAVAHIQRMVMDGILSLLQKYEVKPVEVLAVGVVANSSAIVAHLNLDLEWPIVTTTYQEAFMYGHGSFEADTALAVFQEGILVIRPKGVTSEGLEPFQAATIPSGGSVINWLEQSMSLIESESDLKRMASEVPSSLGVYFVPAIDSLGVPFDDLAATGMWIGLTRGSQRAHLVRAVQESFAFHVKATLEVLFQSDINLAQISVSGDSWLNPFLCQTLADVCQVPAKWHQEKDMALRGAAYKAGLAANLWKTTADVACLALQNECYQPNTDLSTAYAKWRDAVNRAKSENVTVNK